MDHGSALWIKEPFGIHYSSGLDGLNLSWS